MISIVRKTNLLSNSNKWVLNQFKSQLNGKQNQLMRSFMKKPIVQDEQNIHLSIKSLLRPFVFTVGFSGTAFALCSVWNYENTIALRHQFSLQLNNWIQNTPNKNRKEGQLRSQLNEWWNTRNQAFKLFTVIALVNGIVFIGWKIPRLTSFMTKHFMTSIDTKTLKCWPMVFSTFSHYSLTHLVFNMIVLYSFSGIGVHLLGKEQFLAFYLSSGVISSFASYAHKVLTMRTGASLGASGAILGILSSCCVARPDIQLFIIFLPFIPIPAGMALKGIIALDTAGIIFKWNFFDHAAHLGGALFGIWYTLYGQNIIWDNRREVVKVWQQIKIVGNK